MMADKLPFANPDDAAGSVARLAANNPSAAELTRRQTAIADADTACDARSHLRQNTSQALRKFLDALPPELLAQLGEVAHDRTRAYQVARQVISR